MMMSKSSVLLVLSCLAVLPTIAMGAVSLVANLDSAECTGHIQQLTMTAATCDYDDFRCTYGSSVYLTGQVTMNSDIPRPLEVHVVRTLPSFYSLGFGAYDTQIDDICSEGVLTPPEGDSAGYYCPQAGTYNFHFMYDIFGDRNAWYAIWSGFSMGISVHFKHEGGGTDYGTCHLNYRLRKTKDQSFYTSVSFVGFALLGSGLLAGYTVRKRRQERLSTDITLDRSEEEQGEEMVTGFELARDNATV